MQMFKNVSKALFDQLIELLGSSSSGVDSKLIRPSWPKKKKNILLSTRFSVTVNVRRIGFIFT